VSTARNQLITVARDFPLALRRAVDGWDSLTEEYQERLLAAGAEAAELLAAAATGDEDAVHELAILKASMMLWAWAGAEASRRAFVVALREWITEAAKIVGELSLEIVVAAARALVESGLSELEIG